MAKDSILVGAVNSADTKPSTKPSSASDTNGINSLGGRSLEKRSKSSRSQDEVTFVQNSRAKK